MRPKWHFVLRTALMLTGLFLAVLVLLYMVSFIMFVLRQTGVLFVPVFGFRGLVEFLFSLPWLLIFTAFVFLVILEILVRRYSFAYRKPLLYSLVGIILFVGVGSIFVSRSGLHEGFFHYAIERRLPFAGPFYLGYGGARFEHIHPGIVQDMMEDGFHLTDRRGNVFTVVIAPETRFPFGTDFRTGDDVVVFGESATSGAIRALGIRRIDDNPRVPFSGARGRMFPMPPMR